MFHSIVFDLNVKMKYKNGSHCTSIFKPISLFVQNFPQTEFQI